MFSKNTKLCFVMFHGVHDSFLTVCLLLCFNFSAPRNATSSINEISDIKFVVLDSASLFHTFFVLNTGLPINCEINKNFGTSISNWSIF